MIIKSLLVEAKGVVAAYHVVQEIQAARPFTHMVVNVFSYASEEAFLSGATLLYNTQLSVPTDGMQGKMLAALEGWLVTAPESPFVGGTVVSDKSEDLSTLKQRKRAEITRQRVAADNDKFIYQSKMIKTADKDMFDLLIADARWRKGTPANWPGGWKAIDNSYVAISTVEEWDSFFIAMYDTGVANFVRSQKLKALLDEATTPDEVAVITWEMNLE